ncbi:MAG: carboxylating nicotinate-nucleotide diphosphorylase [Candidatus Heimdallarchaeota archaeon]|nr:carboxylating nicotinate-nucleotide diphosphorylase [Candidatus Heimdallarchaeota archaeon]MCK4769544.1 carboxylating nicotinate-nucleotide diphosphorylase [Candidatus Heimdallarchaeota archaeon]
MIPQALVDEDIKKWLAEDISFWDITTSLLVRKTAKAKIYSKQEGVIAGIQIVRRVFELMGAEFESLVKDGQHVNKKTQIASIKGDIHSLLQAERLALNLLGRMSGIATQTATMIEKARSANSTIRICATRKIVPGLSKYDKFAVTIGGGDTHRFNLSDMILLKENHLSIFGSITEAIEKAKEKTSFSKKVEVEVQNEEQALEAVEAGADILMLDNFTPVQAKIVIPKIRKANPKVLIELSGNINLNNLEMYSLEGVDLISSGSLTHSVKNFDLTMLIE